MSHERRAVDVLTEELHSRTGLTVQGTQAIAAALYPPGDSDHPGFPDAHNTKSVRQNSDFEFELSAPARIIDQGGLWDLAVKFDPNDLARPITALAFPHGTTTQPNRYADNMFRTSYGGGGAPFNILNGDDPMEDGAKRETMYHQPVWDPYRHMRTGDSEKVRILGASMKTTCRVKVLDTVGEVYGAKLPPPTREEITHLVTKSIKDGAANYSVPQSYLMSTNLISSDWPLEKSDFRCFGELIQQKASEGSFQICPLLKHDNSYTSVKDAAAVRTTQAGQMAADIVWSGDGVGIADVTFSLDSEDYWNRHGDGITSSEVNPLPSNWAGDNLGFFGTKEVPKNFPIVPAHRPNSWRLPGNDGVYDNIRGLLYPANLIANDVNAWGQTCVLYRGIDASAVVSVFVNRDLEYLPMMRTDSVTRASKPCGPDYMAIHTGMQLLNDVPALMPSKANSTGHFLKTVWRTIKAHMPDIVDTATMLGSTFFPAAAPAIAAVGGAVKPLTVQMASKARQDLTKARAQRKALAAQHKGNTRLLGGNDRPKVGRSTK